MQEKKGRKLMLVPISLLDTALANYPVNDDGSGSIGDHNTLKLNTL